MPSAWREEAIDERTYLVELSGHVDFLDVKLLEHRLIDLSATGHTGIVLDLHDAGPIEEGFLVALLRINRRLGWRNGRLAVVDPVPDSGWLHPAGDDAGLDVVPTRDDALSLVGASRTARG